MPSRRLSAGRTLGLVSCALSLMAGCGGASDALDSGADAGLGTVVPDAGTGSLDFSGPGTQVAADAGPQEPAGLVDAGPQLPPQVADAGGALPGPPTVHGCQVLPADSFWNTDISHYPLSAHSDDYVRAMGLGTGMHPDFGTEWNGVPIGMPYLLVNGDAHYWHYVDFTNPDESDRGYYPAPLDAAIQGGPDSTGDRHVIVIDTTACVLYEMYKAYPGDEGWTAVSGAVWHLDQNEQRPDRYTSADAAGLPIFPGLVRYDEVMEQGEINHALRVTASSAQLAYVYPATHSDGRAGHDPTHPPMGTRFRLKASFDITPFPPEVQVILKAAKKYGLVLADTGDDWVLSGAPDPRWDDSKLEKMSQVTGADFEAVDTGPVHPW